MITTRLLRALLLCLAFALPAIPQAAEEAPASTQPFPTLDVGMHTAIIKRFAVDRAGRYGVSASYDKTARVWDLQTGQLLQTLRVPVGPNHEGRLYAAAISPNGDTVAVSTSSGSSRAGSNSVFFFDWIRGHLIGRITDLPNVANHLTWSPDGQSIALALGGPNGIRLYSACPPYTQLARSGADDSSYSVDFAPDGSRLVSTSYDRKLRIYDKNLNQLVPPHELEGGIRPFFARFSPDGQRIAVGSADSTDVYIVSSTDLKPVAHMDQIRDSEGDLSKVAWSNDGLRLYAAGRNIEVNQTVIRILNRAGGLIPVWWFVATDTVMDLHPLSDGRLVFSAATPAWGILGANGAPLILHPPPLPDHRDNLRDLRLSLSGDQISFVHTTWRDGHWHRQSLRFDLRGPHLIKDLTPNESQLVPPRWQGLELRRWLNNLRPSIAGQTLELESDEISRSLAISADGRYFALGTELYIRWFEADGKQVWKQAVPSVAWLVNTTTDGRFVVAALGDGTIRWYRSQDGSEALALFVHADGERWVAWTPEGFFAASSPEAEKLFGYTLNQGREQAADFVSSAQLREQFYRPALLTARLDGNEAAIAAAVAEVGDVRAVLAQGLPPELGEPMLTPLGDGEYALNMAVTPRSGGLGRASIRVNGVEQAPSREVPAGGPFNQRLRFQPGQVKLEVGFYAAGNTLLSKTRTLEINVPEPKVVPLRKPRLYVVAAGVSRYYDPSLRDGVSYAADDARSVADTLRRHHDATLVELARPYLFTELEATRDNIVAALQAVAREAQPEDVLVVYLAGHGTHDDRGDYLYQPYEVRYTNRAALLAQSLSGSRLRELLADIKASKAVVLLDTCASGKFFLASAPTSRDPASKEAITRFASLSGRAVISAAAREAREHASLNHGLFTAALLRGLEGAAANRQGEVMVSGLADYVEEDVERNAVRLFGDPQVTQREFAPAFRNFMLTRKR